MHPCHGLKVWSVQAIEVFSAIIFLIVEYWSSELEIPVGMVAGVAGFTLTQRAANRLAAYRLLRPWLIATVDRQLRPSEVIHWWIVVECWWGYQVLAHHSSTPAGTVSAGMHSSMDASSSSMSNSVGMAIFISIILA